jgi:UDP-glucuronate 4-epimerase
MQEKILVTGAAGFIGFHVVGKLLARGHEVVGLDNLNDYYDPTLKQRRLEQLWPASGFRFVRMDLADRAAMEQLFVREAFPCVIHLGAQAGVRYSLQNPHAYVDSNLVGFINVLEGCRHNGCRHLVYASSSSVYGANTRMPFRTQDNVDHPISLYAATKKANELMAHSYAHLYGLPCTGLRFFTAYGPWGRPDMAMWLFTKAIFAGEPIRLFDYGRVRRDFTYVDDVVEAVVRLVGVPPAPDPAWFGEAPDPSTSYAPWRVHNIGNRNPIEITEVVRLLEGAIGRPAVKVLEPLQPGDVTATYADVSSLQAAVDFQPDTPIKEGIARFVAWYKDYHGLA